METHKGAAVLRPKKWQDSTDIKFQDKYETGTCRHDGRAHVPPLVFTLHSWLACKSWEAPMLASKVGAFCRSGVCFVFIFGWGSASFSRCGGRFRRQPSTIFLHKQLVLGLCCLLGYPASALRCSTRVLQRSAPANSGNLDLPGSKPT